MTPADPKHPSPPGEPNRREFLRLAGGVVALGTGAGLTLPGCASSKASAGSGSLPALRSQSGGTTVKGIQHFRSRPDLQPPEIRIDVHAKDVIPGFVFTDCHGGYAQQGPMILTETGRLVGFLPLTPKPTVAHRAFNVRVQTYQGKPVMTYFVGGVVSAHGAGHYVIYDENYHLVAQVHAGNGYQGDLHEFLLTDQGTALFTAYGEAVGPYPGSGRRGKYFYGIVQEVDVASGKVLFQWRSDQHVGLAESYYPAPANPANTWDYFHVNAITIDPTDNNLVISSRNTCAAYKVDRTTGRVIWKLGGKHSNFHMGKGSRFYFQHDVNLHPGGVVTIFDNEGGPPRADPVSPQAAGPVGGTRQRPAAGQGPHVHGLGHLELLHGVRARRHGAIRRPPDPGDALLPSVQGNLDRDADDRSQPGCDPQRPRSHALRQLELRDRGGRLGGALRPPSRCAQRRRRGEPRRLRDRDLGSAREGVRCRRGDRQQRRGPG
jgi:hypothetical protein